MKKGTIIVILGIILVLYALQGNNALVNQSETPTNTKVDTPDASPPPTSGGVDAPDTTQLVEFSQQPQTNIDDQEVSLIYDDYLSKFVKTSGRTISNYQPVSWCPNDCISCDDDQSSEHKGRAMVVAAMLGDKDTFDKLVDSYRTVQAHPDTGYMMWNLDKDGVPITSCGGQNTAIDAELEAIEALSIARDNGWTKDSKGRSYLETQKLLMDGIRGATIQTPYGPVFSFCGYPQGTETRPCTQVVYIGYLNLRALDEACKVDSTYCPIRDASKALVADAIQGETIHTSYDNTNGQFGFREHFVHNLWVLEHAIEGGVATQKTSALYQLSRDRYYEDGMVCQEYKSTGCKYAHPTIFVYAEYLEMAIEKDDLAFAQSMASEIFKRCPEAPEQCGYDNYKRVATLQALAKAIYENKPLRE